LPWFEESADAALVRVCDRDGSTRGTAFFVSADGAVLTCHHVVSGLEETWLEAAGRPRRMVARDRIELFPEFDLALLHTDTPGQPLPIGLADGGSERFWTKGYHQLGGQIRAAFPAEGTGSGRTNVLYSSGETEYAIKDVLVLRDEEFAAGLSGAPVLDVETGAAFAIVSTKYRKPGRIAGFALPLSKPVQHVPAINQLVAGNQATVPAYGRFLNRAAAQRVCERQRDAALREIVGANQVPLDRHTPRRAFEAATARFAAGQAQIIALVGQSGVGKTTEAAWLVSTYAGPVILLRGAALRPEHRDLSDAVGEALATVAEPRMLPAPIATRLVEALTGLPVPVLVVLDGLNEAPAQVGGRIRDWIWRSAEWLRQTQARLVVTSRPEFWEQARNHFPKELLFRPKAMPAEDTDTTGASHTSRAVQHVALDDFSEPEASAALSAYGLGESGLTPDDVRHPLLIRLYADLAAHRPDSLRRVSRLDVVDGYVELKCRSVIDAMDGEVSYGRVRGLVIEVAAAMVAAGEDRLGHAAYFGLFGADRRIADLLVDEHLLSMAGRDYRFVFDYVAEYLQAEALDPAQVLSPASLQALGRSGPYRYGVVAVTLLLLERREGPEALDRELRTIAEMYATSRSWPLGGVLREVLPQVTDPMNHLEVLTRIAQTVDDRYFQPFTPDFWRAIRLPLREELGLLRILARVETSYDWEAGHWSLLDDVAKWPDSFAALAGEHIRTAPVAAFQELISWFADESQLREGAVARVGDVAAGLMYWQRRLALDELYELLATAGHPRARVLLASLCQAEQTAGCGVAERWAQSVDATRQELALHSAWHLLHAELAPGDHRRVLGAVRRLALDGPPAVQRSALPLLLRDEGTRGEFLRRGIEAFLADDSHIGPRDLEPALGSHPGLVVDAFETYLARGHGLGRRVEILRVLGDHPEVPIVRERGTAIVEALLLREDQELASGVGDLVEGWLRGTEGEPSSAVVGLAEKVIRRGGPQGRRPLIYVLTSRNAEVASQPLGHRLTELLIEHEDDDNNLALIIDKVCASGLPNAISVVRAVQTRMDVELFDKRLVAIALHPANAETLAEWFRSDPGLGRGTLSTELQARTQRGEAPNEAAFDILWEAKHGPR
jgi:Trypsin-like peptidase domain/NACHT domain